MPARVASADGESNHKPGCSFWVWVVGYSSILPIITCYCFITGALEFAQGMNKKKSLGRVSPAEPFENLGPVCRIEEVLLDSYTKKGTETDCPLNVDVCKSKVYHVCVDEMSYTFTVGDVNDTLYRSRIHVSQRNREYGGSHSGRVPDRCDGDGVRPYNGSFTYTNALRGHKTPFVCDGGICKAGEVVNCWQPSESCSGDGCAEDFPWAGCGNADCKKLVEPELEYDDAVSDARDSINAGVILMALGASFFCFIGCVCACVFFLGRRADDGDM